jgi:hypothetical protein
MRVQKADGGYGLVWFKWTIHQTAVMYTLTAEKAHTYFVGQGQWFVHDTCNSSRLEPDSTATGPHSTFVRDPQTGGVVKYAIYQPQTNPENPNTWEQVKGFDAYGDPHFNEYFR